MLDFSMVSVPLRLAASFAQIEKGERALQSTDAEIEALKGKSSNTDESNAAAIKSLEEECASLNAVQR